MKPGSNSASSAWAASSLSPAGRGVLARACVHAVRADLAPAQRGSGLVAAVSPRQALRQRPAGMQAEGAPGSPVPGAQPATQAGPCSAGPAELGPSTRNTAAAQTQEAPKLNLLLSLVLKTAVPAAVWNSPGKFPQTARQ